MPSWFIHINRSVVNTICSWFTNLDKIYKGFFLSVIRINSGIKVYLDYYNKIIDSNFGALIPRNRNSTVLCLNFFNIRLPIGFFCLNQVSLIINKNSFTKSGNHLDFFWIFQSSACTLDSRSIMGDSLVYVPEISNFHV